MQLNADHWLKYLTTIAHPDFGTIYAMGAAGRAKLDQRQFGQVFLLCCANFMACETQHYQFCLGLLDTDAYDGYRTTIREQIMALPGIRAMWQLVRHSYSKEFAAFMGEQISALPPHEAESTFRKWSALVEEQSRGINCSKKEV